MHTRLHGVFPDYRLIPPTGWCNRNNCYILPFFKQKPTPECELQGQDYSVHRR